MSFTAGEAVPLDWQVPYLIDFAFLLAGNSQTLSPITALQSPNTGVETIPACLFLWYLIGVGWGDKGEWGDDGVLVDALEGTVDHPAQDVDRGYHYRDDGD